MLKEYLWVQLTQLFYIFAAKQHISLSKTWLNFQAQKAFLAKGK